MSNSDKIEFNGVVKKALPGAKFEVEIEPVQGKSKLTVLCTISGKLRQNMIKIIPEDSVTVSVSAYDLTRGIITWRNK